MWLLGKVTVLIANTVRIHQFVVYVSVTIRSRSKVDPRITITELPSTSKSFGRYLTALNMGLEGAGFEVVQGTSDTSNGGNNNTY